MMGEVPHMPTRDEIYEKAVELFQTEAAKKGLPPITPEEEELKEGNYWEAARNELMTGVRDQLEQYLRFLKDETQKVMESLGIAPPPQVEELRERLEDISDKYKRSRDELRKTKAELERLKKPPPPLVPPKPPPIPAVPGKLPPLPEGEITEEWVEAVLKIDPRVKPEVGTHTDYTYSVYLNKWIEELGESVPLGIMPLKTPPEVEEFLKRGEFEGWVWRLEDITYSPEYLAWRDIYFKTYSRTELDYMTRQAIEEVVRVKRLKTGTKDEMIANILGITPPTAPPPAAPPPPKPPPKAPPTAPPTKGLSPPHEAIIRDEFYAALSRARVRVTPGIRSEFRIKLIEEREGVKDLPSEDAFKEAKMRMDEFAKEIIERETAPRVRPRVPAPLALPEARVAIAPIPTWTTWRAPEFSPRRMVEERAPLKAEEIPEFLKWLEQGQMTMEEYEKLPEEVKAGLRAQYRHEIGLVKKREIETTELEMFRDFLLARGLSISEYDMMPEEMKESLRAEFRRRYRLES